MSEKRINKKQKWRPSITHYRSTELRALTFASVDDVDRAIYCCWNDPELKCMPRYTPDGMTMFVPLEAVPYFQKKKDLEFCVNPLVNPDRTPAEDRWEARMRYWRGEGGTSCPS